MKLIKMFSKGYDRWGCISYFIHRYEEIIKYFQLKYFKLESNTNIFCRNLELLYTYNTRWILNYKIYIIPVCYKKWNQTKNITQYLYSLQI